MKSVNQKLTSKTSSYKVLRARTTDDGRTDNLTSDRFVLRSTTFAPARIPVRPRPRYVDAAAAAARSFSFLFNSLLRLRSPSSNSVFSRRPREKRQRAHVCERNHLGPQAQVHTQSTHRSYVNRHLTSAPSTTPFHRGHLLSETLTSRHRRRRPQLLPVTQPILGRLPKANV